MKFVIAMMQHETNTFSPLPTRLEAFWRGLGCDAPLTGAHVTETLGGTGTAVGAFIDFVREHGFEYTTPVAAFAEPAGFVDDDAFEYIASSICEAVSEGCDAVLLDLHGAMVTQSRTDGEGELLRRLRQINPDVPIGVALDFHTNMTAAMAENASVITGYRTYPHTDMHETGARCAETIFKMLNGDAAPEIIWGRLPLMSALLRQTPDKEPMKTPMAHARKAEMEGEVLNASIFAGFPLADIPHVSLSAVIAADRNTAGGADSARRVLDRILSAAWDARADFVLQNETTADVIRRAKTMTEGPVILADYGDNCGAGGQADDMTVIREAMEQGLEDVAAGTVWDPDALAVLQKAGVGAEVTLDVGGKTDSPALGLKGRPLTLKGTVKNLTDGRFILQGDMMSGFPVDMRGCAVLDTGPMEIIVSGERVEPYTPQYFTHAGIDPFSKHYVILKSRQHFRAAFEARAKAVLSVCGGGVCGEDHVNMPFSNLTRPIYPLDRNTAWPES